MRERLETEERENWRDHRQDRNLTRILATVIGEKVKTELRQIGNLGNRRPKMSEDRQRHPLDKDQCAYCKEKGHWARECPKKKGRASKVLALEEDD